MHRRIGRLSLLLLLAAASCRQPDKDKDSAGAAAPPSAPPAPARAPRAAAPDPALAEDTSAPIAYQPVTDEPPELASIKSRIFAGERGKSMMKDAHKLSHKYTRNAEAAYILGSLYCEKLWMVDGMTAFRRAIQLDPAYRANEYLIRAVVNGLGNDGDHQKVHRFLVEDIGRPAAPYLEEVLQGSYRQQVKDRAAAILQELK